jgi:predicted nucleotidyltransferase
MRLSKSQREVIIDIIRRFDPDADVRLFGSRVLDNQKGGDIDLLILSKIIDYHHKLKIRSLLKQELGDRKIDIIVTNEPVSAFQNIAFKNSVKV